MMLWIIAVGLVLVVGVGAIMVRLRSLRSPVPCPARWRWLIELDNPFFRNNRAVAIIGHLGLEPGMRVLDVGCGPGRLTIPAARQVGPAGEVTAFDIQSDMLQRTMARAQAEKLTNIRFMQGEIGSGKLDRNRHDRALLVTVLGELPDPKVALAKIFDSLKPGGVLSVTEVIADPDFRGRQVVTEAADSVGFIEKAFFGNRCSFTMHFEKPPTCGEN
jgi:ubiquinone/menaquinone biosynthesis C-methylase UbiE